MSKTIRDIQPHWTVVRPYLSIRNEEDYDRALEKMNELIDIVGTNEDHPMYEFLDTLGISQYRLAKDIGVPPMRINKIVRGQRGISADTALRLARYFAMSVEFWTGIQTHYEVEMARMALADRLEKEVKVYAAA